MTRPHCDHFETLDGQRLNWRQAFDRICRGESVLGGFNISKTLDASRIQDWCEKQNVYPRLSRLGGNPHWTLIETGGRRKIVCLCGSTRFKDQFKEAYLNESLKGHIVLTVSCFRDEYELSQEEKERVDGLHLDRIRLSDDVLFINVDGYIGESSKKELAFAKELGKVIRFWE